jgi:hypothetical protein
MAFSAMECHLLISLMISQLNNEERSKPIALLEPVEAKQHFLA